MVLKKNPLIIIVLGLVLTLTLITLMAWKLYSNQTMIRQNLTQLDHTENLRLRLNKDYNDINTIFRIQLFSPSKANIDLYDDHIKKIHEDLRTAKRFAIHNGVVPTYNELKKQLDWLLSSQKTILMDAQLDNHKGVHTLLFNPRYRDVEIQYAYTIQQLVNANSSFQYWLALCHDLALFQNYQTSLMYLAITDNSGLVNQNYIAYTDHVSRLLSEAIHATNPLIPTHTFVDAQQHFKALLQLNNRIFQYIRDGEQTKAIQLLMSPSYRNAHTAYINDIKDATTQVNKLVKRKITHANEYLDSIAIVLGVILLIFIMLWFMIIAMLRQWKVRLEETNAQLDYKVEQRTKKLIEEIRAHKQAEKDKAKLEQALRQNQKLQSIGILAAGIAHDFNNLLAIILANSESIVMNNLEEQQALISIIKATQEAGKLTQQLLTFARQTPLKKTTININEAIEETLQLMRTSIPSNISIQTQIDNNLNTIQADKNQLSQVLLNLGLNAKDAMPNGGDLIISSCSINLTTPIPAHLSQLKPGKHVKIMIKDTGIGIDKNNIMHIFDPFFTTKKIGKGTGLGLATVYGIMTQHKGCITVESNKKGTTFSLYFSN